MSPRVVRGYVYDDGSRAAPRKRLNKIIRPGAPLKLPSHCIKEKTSAARQRQVPRSNNRVGTRRSQTKTSPVAGGAVKAPNQAASKKKHLITDTGYNSRCVEEKAPTMDTRYNSYCVKEKTTTDNGHQIQIPPTTANDVHRTKRG